MNSNNINNNLNISSNNSNIANSNNNINISNNNSNISSRRFVDQEVGTDEIYSNNNSNLSNFQNKNTNSQLLNNYQQNNIQNQIISNNDSKISQNDLPVVVENFSQQVDFLFHPENPEYEPSLAKIKKKYNKVKRQNSAKPLKKFGKTKKSKSKENNRKKSISKKNIIKPDFNLCTKTNPKGLINPDLKKYELTYESRYKQQCRERQRKIAEYDKNFLRTKDNFNAKKKLMKDWNLCFNYPNKDDISKNGNENNNSDYLLYKLQNLSEPDIPQHIAKKMDFNPVKYDYIINSLLYEITDIKKQRKKENADFKNKIKQLQGDLNKNNKRKNKSKNKDIKRPKTSCKLKSNKNEKVNIHKNPDNFIKNLVAKYFNSNIKSKNSRNNIEHEIPANDLNNNFHIEGMDAKIMNDDRMNEFYYGQKMQILNNLSQIQKENKQLNQQLRDKLSENNSYNSKNNLTVYSYNEYVTNKNNNNYYNDNNFISKSNDNKNNNQTPNKNYNNNQIQFNMIDNINIKTLNYQDKMQILAQLNNSIAQYTKGIPKLVNKVNETLDKMYGKINNPIVKAINNNPLVKITSKSLYHSISTKSDRLTEAIIDDLLLDCVYDLTEIEDVQKSKFKKKDLLNGLNEAYNNLFFISQKEFNVFKENNLNDNNTQNNNNKNDNKKELNGPVLYMKFRASPGIKTVNLCEKYKNEFKDYMTTKGDKGYTKYDLYKIYEEFFDKEIKYMLNEEINGYIKHLDDCAKQMYYDEILELNKINK